MSNPPRKKNKDELEPASREMLDAELEEFFADRALERAQHIADKPKNETAKDRDEDPDPSMSGCCMTGCADCPWGYIVPKPA